MNLITFIFIFLWCFLPFKVMAVTPLAADTIPFEIGPDKRMYVTTYINGNLNKPFRFLVDTGASSVVLNASLPQVMGMAEFTSQVVNQGPTSSEVIPSTAPKQKIQIGKCEVTDLSFISIPYPPQAWDGVLGLSFLRCFDILFNYDRKEMYLYARGQAPKPKSEGVSFVYKANVPVIPVAVTINGIDHQLQVELDTGSDRVLDINTPYVEAHHLRGSLDVFAVSSISGSSQNQGYLENVCFDSAEIGGTIFPLLPGAFSTLTTGLQATKEFDGVIGNNLLQRFNQQWDFVNNKVYFTVNHRYYTPFYEFL